MSTQEIIGLMSGTSLDGLDIVHIQFVTDKQEIKFELKNYTNIPYPEEIVQELQSVHQLGIQSIYLLDKKIGKFYADCINLFIKNKNIDRKNIELIASHGQTIFHQPKLGYTVQIGCGDTIAFHTGIKVVNDFRTKDVIAGGQGAPLVPIGDFDLFGNKADAFLNIGGFTNISYKKNSEIIAFDICPGNLPLNKLVQTKGLTYDDKGDLAKSGEINFFLFDLLNKLPYYEALPPKSLGTEWLEEQFYPMLKFDNEIENNLRTVVEHLSLQIANVLNNEHLSSVFISGGGALNLFLIERIKHYYKGEIIIPSREIIEFKEAIIFAYLGFLYHKNMPNNVPSVTGACKKVVGGVLHTP